jgi:glycosyltransferase involved in cell wall biosynthesis
VLEALARGLPVVATPAGVQGIEADESTGCLVGATPEDLAASMRMAFDPETNLRLSKAARSAWDQTYSPAVVRAQYDEIFGLVNGVATPSIAADVEASAPEHGW